MDRTTAMRIRSERPNSLQADELTVRFVQGAMDAAIQQSAELEDEIGGSFRIEPDYTNLCVWLFVDDEDDASYIAYMSDEHADARFIVQSVAEMVTH